MQAIPHNKDGGQSDEDKGQSEHSWHHARPTAAFAEMEQDVEEQMRPLRAHLPTQLVAAEEGGRLCPEDGQWMSSPLSARWHRVAGHGGHL